MTMPTILGGVVVGVGATVVSDLWNLLLKHAFGIPSLNLCLLGRWLLHIPTGTFVHASIATAAPKTHECTVGFVAHYAIGAAFALSLVFITSGDWLARPTLLPALSLGLITLVFPFFLMQPALGLGFASSRSPNPMLARFKSLMTHLTFGLGLYLWALVVSRFLP